MWGVQEGKNGKTVFSGISSSPCKSSEGIEIVQNNAQVLWDMMQPLRDDPSRRFVFGFTVEDTGIRIWICDRAGAVVSEEFDFVRVRPIMLSIFKIY